jgi:hypothetical protein
VKKDGVVGGEVGGEAASSRKVPDLNDGVLRTGKDIYVIFPVLVTV